ncbi:hypothetical protein [Streptomyces microflavus]|uniref:hypothetical protein n=1 Tax=Streptomyces microflavus TaxID=1919 RepID=UPI00324550E2
MQLPEQPVAGQPTDNPLAQAVNEAITKELAKTYHRDNTPVPLIGTAPPVPQPGPPPMSQWAIDASGVLKGVGAVSIPIGVGVWIVGQIEPWALAIIFGSPAVAALAVARLVAKIKDATQNAPQPVTQNLYGPVTVNHDERTLNADARGIWAKTTNNN